MTLCPRRSRVLAYTRGGLGSGCRVALLFIIAVRAVAALEPSDWKNRQDLVVTTPGVTKVALPLSTLDLAQPDLRDLRLIDATGKEFPFLVQRPAPPATPLPRPAASFRSTLGSTETELVVETGTAQPLASIELHSPEPAFIKAARVEILDGDGAWKAAGTGLPVFRQAGAAQLRLPLGGQKTARVRVTLDDTRGRPVAFTGATLLLSATVPSPGEPLPLQLLRREEFVGETVLTLDLGAANIPVASLEWISPESLFTRTVTLAVSELRNGQPGERTLATGMIYRVSADGLAPSAQLALPVEAVVPSRQVTIHLANRDSPPLALDEVRGRQRVQWLVFRAPAAGTYTVLTGNAGAPAPSYDLAALATVLEAVEPSGVTLGAPQLNPGYRRPETLRDTPLVGAALDPAPWLYRRDVLLSSSGVQELELPLEVLADAQPGLGDLRLVRNGQQIPYLLERTALSRAFALVLVPADDPQRPRLSRWQLKLPRENLPLSRLTVNSSTGLFERRMRLIGSFRDDRGNTHPLTLAEADWHREPGQARPLVMTFFSEPRGDTLWLETDNGDNPSLALVDAQTAYPVIRLLFKAEPGPLSLYYGNPAAAAPRYDISLVAAPILAAEKAIATLGPGGLAKTGGKGSSGLLGIPGGLVFWGALGLVVIGLLAVVAKLLPKPPAP